MVSTCFYCVQTILDAVHIFNGYSWEKIHTSNRYLKGNDGNLISYIHEEELGACYDIAYNDGTDESNVPRNMIKVSMSPKNKKLARNRNRRDRFDID